MKKELKIRMDIYGKAIIGEILDMDDSERGKRLLIKLDDNKIVKELYSFHCPSLDNERFCIQGTCKNMDREEFYKSYKTTDETKQVYEDILRLVEEYNKQLNK